MSTYVDPDLNFLALDGDAFRAPVGTTIADATALSTLSATWLPYGAVEAGFGIITDLDTTEKAVWNKPGAPYRIITRNEIKTVTFKAPDRSIATVKTLSRGGSATQVTGTAEVQTLTITGTPTGGTFAVTWDGQTTSAVAYNASAATLQTALEALSNIAPGDVVVTGSAGGPYTLTWNVLLGDVSQPTVAHAFTGGTSPNITAATTTPGVGPIFKWTDNPVGKDEFAFVVDVRDGTKHIRYLFPRVALDGVPTETHDGDDLGPEFTLTVLAPDSGDNYYKWSNFNPFV